MCIDLSNNLTARSIVYCSMMKHCMHSNLHLACIVIINVTGMSLWIMNNVEYLPILYHCIHLKVIN